MPGLLTYDWKEPNFDWIGGMVQNAARLRLEQETQKQSMALQLMKSAQEASQFQQSQEMRARELDFSHQYQLAEGQRAQDKIALEAKQYGNLYGPNADGSPAPGAYPTISDGSSVPPITTGGSLPMEPPLMTSDVPAIVESDPSPSPASAHDEPSAPLAPAVAPSMAQTIAGTAPELIPGLPTGDALADPSLPLMPPSQRPVNSTGSMAQTLSAMGPEEAVSMARKLGLPPAVAAQWGSQAITSKQQAAAQARVDAADRQANARVQAAQIAADARIKTSGGDPAALTEGMEYNAEHGTFKRPDGSEWFVSGHKLMSFRPQQVKAERWAQGDDGKVYPLGSNGEPLKPIPDGVHVSLNPGKIQTTKDNLGNVYAVGADQQLRLLVPAQIKISAKERDDYIKDMQAATAAKTESDTLNSALKEKGDKGLTNWFGISKDKADAAQKEADEAAAKVKTWVDQYPQLGKAPLTPVGSPPETPAATPAAAANPSPSAAPQNPSDDTARPKTKAERDALPKGAKYYGPDGKIYTRQ